MGYKERITLKDLSELIKLSPSTISNALRGSRTVNSKTKRKVLKAAETYGYILKVKNDNVVTAASFVSHEKPTIYDIAKLLNVDASTVSRALANDSRVKTSTRVKILELAAAINYKADENAKTLVYYRKQHSGNTTIYDIAATLGMAASTVSRSLSGKKVINKNTAESVKKTSRDFAFSPSAEAIKLGGTKMLSIGVFVPGFSTQINSILEGMDVVAKSCKINLTVCNALSTSPIKTKHISSVLNVSDGVIIIPDPYNELNVFEKKISRKQIPTVCLGSYQDAGSMETITISPYQTLYDITKYLIKLGKSKICYVDPMSDNQSSLRMDGFNQALAEDYLTRTNQIVIQGGNRIFSPGDLADKILSQQFIPDAIIIVNSQLNERGISRLESAGIKTDSSVVVCEFHRGFVDKNSCHKNMLVSYDFNDLGQKAITTLLSKIRQDSPFPALPIYATHLFYGKPQKLNVQHPYDDKNFNVISL